MTWAQKNRDAALQYAFRRHLGGELQFLLAGGAVAFAVKADFVMVFSMKMERFMGQDFKGPQNFSAALQQQLAVRAGKFHQDVRRLQLRSAGGFTVMRYFNLNAPEEITFFRNASIFFAVATLSCSICRSNSPGNFTALPP